MYLTTSDGWTLTVFGSRQGQVAVRSNRAKHFCLQ